MKNIDINQRICIIGAGPSGLSAAEALIDKGYRNVTILEKRDRVGGQSMTQTYTTPSGKNIIYDLGSLIPISTGSGATKKLLDRYDLHLGRGINANKPAYLKMIDIENKKVLLDFTKYQLGRPLSLKFISDFLHDAFILSKQLIRYRALSKPGYEHIDEKLAQELYIPYEEWLDNLKLKLVTNDLKYTFGMVLTFSKGELKNNIGAINLMKLIYQLLKYPMRYINGTFVQITEGYQELWTRVAKNKDVRLNTFINKITRDNNEIHVHTQNGELVFDKLIMTCAAFETKKMLDLTHAEEEIFNKVNYAPGWRGAFLAKNLPHDAVYYFPYAYIHENSASLAALIPEGQVDDETWLYSCIMARRSVGDAIDQPPIQESEKMLKDYFPVTDIQWLTTVYWHEYGSYFGIQDERKNIYQQIASMQGDNNTYFIGEIVANGTHALVSNYSFYFVDKHF